MQTAAIGFIVWWAIVSIYLVVTTEIDDSLILHILHCTILGFSLAFNLGVIAAMIFVISVAIGF